MVQNEVVHPLEVQRAMDPIQMQRLHELAPDAERWRVRMSRLDVAGANEVTLSTADRLRGGYHDILSAPSEDAGLDHASVENLREMLGIHTVRDFVATTVEEMMEHRDMFWINKVQNMILLWLAEKLDFSKQISDLT